MSKIWAIEEIHLYISNEIEENLHLEYKGADSLEKSEGKKREICKDVSAFLNSAGGVLIYGLKEFHEKEKSHLPEKIDPIDRNTFSKEWLEQIINSGISPRPHNIKIHPISASESGVVFVLEIPKSPIGHQSKDKRYYKRFNFESVMMDDWEIRDIMNRRNRTDFKIHFIPIQFDPVSKAIRRVISNTIDYEIFAHNTGSIVSKHIACFLRFDNKFRGVIASPKLDIFTQYSQIRFSNEQERTIKIGTEEFVINSFYRPFLPNEWSEIGVLKVKKNFFSECNQFTCMISSDDNYREVTVETSQLYDKTTETAQEAEF